MSEAGTAPPDALPTTADPATDEAAASDVLAEVEQLIGALTAHPDPVVGQSVSALLERIDAVHRTALTHLLGAVQSMAGDAFVNRLTGDPAIRLLLMSYDLLAVDRRTLTEEAIDAVRGHLHSHGIDVELVDVLGGVVSVRLHGAPPASDPVVDGIRRDIAEALRSGLLGFQELEIVTGKGTRAAPADSVFLPYQALKRAHRPVYRAVGMADEMLEGTVRGLMIDEVGVLLAKADGEVFAVRNACGDGPLPLNYSTLDGVTLRCSWHGCEYDIRTGRRLNYARATETDHLRVLPVRVTDGVIEVVVGTAPA